MSASLDQDEPSLLKRYGPIWVICAIVIGGTFILRPDAILPVTIILALILPAIAIYQGLPRWIPIASATIGVCLAMTPLAIGTLHVRDAEAATGPKLDKDIETITAKRSEILDQIDIFHRMVESGVFDAKLELSPPAPDRADLAFTHNFGVRPAFAMLGNDRDGMVSLFDISPQAARMTLKKHLVLSPKSDADWQKFGATGDVLAAVVYCGYDAADELIKVNIAPATSRLNLLSVPGYESVETLCAAGLEKAESDEAAN